MSDAFWRMGEPGYDALDSAVEVAPSMVAPTSTIPIPAWMRGGATSFDYAPGCSPLPYRPTGFLSRAAEERRSGYYALMNRTACRHGVPAGLFDALLIQESRYDPLATSSKRAFGIAQLMPATAAALGVDRFDPAANMAGGARYLRRQLDTFGHVHLALAAYNAGPRRVRNGLVPRIAETQAYVAEILANWSRISASGPSLTLPTVPQHDRRRQPVVLTF